MAASEPTVTLPDAPEGNLPQRPWLLLSMEEGGYAHLFEFRIDTASLRRLTTGTWHDATPSLSPDGNSIAFSSDRGGFWDLYTMDLRTAVVSQLTDTPEYDGTPVWSPDMAWMAYETYRGDQLDVAVLGLIDPSAEPVLLTDNPASDHSPAWSPDGRKIAFVSSRTGDADIWLADLDNTSNRFTNLTQSSRTAEQHPVWNREGSRLAWGSMMLSPGDSGVYLWDPANPTRPAVRAGSGSWPAWNSDGTQLAASVESPTGQLLAAYSLAGAPLMLPFPLGGTVRGLAWPSISLPDPLPSDFRNASQAPAPSPPIASASSLSEIPGKRWHIVPLADVQAPSAGLHALVAPSFDALRARLITETGWDPLASLESTFVPLTTSLDPGLEQDWLYTGRAFTINTLMLNAGWMAAERHDIGDRTYWQIYVRAREQGGSMGTPLKDPPWDPNSRFQLDPQAYEDGGSYAVVPAGYWVDVTSIARVFGWQRLAALPGWRNYYPGARFSEFVSAGDLDWYSAMLELYPPEALITPTAVMAPTITPTRTPRPTTTPYPTWTPRATLTASPTSTPAPPTNTPPTVIPTFPSPTP